MKKTAKTGTPRKASTRRKAPKKPALVEQAPPTAAQLRRQLLATVIAAGIDQLHAMLEEDREQLCGPRYQHSAEREVVRGGHADGELVLGGRRVRVLRPRVRRVGQGVGGEVHLPTWEAFADEDPLQQRALEQMVIGVSTRKYSRSLEAMDAEVASRGTAKSAVSRRFVVGTQKKLQELKTRSLAELDLLVLMIDGVHFSDHVVLVALGIDADGKKHILGLCEGATENTVACSSLLGNLVERGLDTSRPILAVLDGAKALRRAVLDFYGKRALIQRCQEHKKRNVLAHLPDDMHVSVRLAMNQAYQCGSQKRAKKLLQNLARRLDQDRPGAAESLREGLDETLTVLGLGLSKTLLRSLATTNAIENTIGTVRTVSRRVKRWRSGAMIMRWMAAGLMEAERSFHRIKGYRGLPKLQLALSRHGARSAARTEQLEATGS